MDTRRTEDIDVTLTEAEVIDIVLAKYPELEYLREHHMIMYVNQAYERIGKSGIEVISTLSLCWKRKL